VSAVLNLYEINDYEQAAGRLLAEGIEARHLRDRASIGTVCRDYVTR